ncbi:MAG: M6 family metalloprotease domain-containing protein, partial [Marinilabiliaceae bacterium]
MKIGLFMGYFTQGKNVFRVLIIGLILNILPFQQIFSIGAYPYPMEVSQPDGSVLTIRNHGDEWYNWTTTEDGYRIVKSADGTFEYATQLKSGEITSSGIQASDPGKRSSEEKDFLSKTSKNIGVSGEEIRKKRNQRYQPLLKSSLMSTHFPSEGEPNLLVILANFNDTQSTYSTNDFDAFMNEAGYEGTGSFKDYYEEVSGGKLTVNSTVTQWVQVPEDHDYYGPEEKWGEFALQAVQAAADAGVDFSRFDNDGDGVVEGVAIIHQGAGEEVTADANDIWSHSYSFSSSGVEESERTFDGVVVDQYTVQPEWRTNAAEMNTIGVISHEFGHNLGLIDFYDVDEEHYEGTGVWDIMAAGAYNGSPTGSQPAHHNPFSKNELNWVDVTTIEEAGNITLEPVYNEGQVLRVNSPVDNEYLLLENRQKTGFDSELPGPGMLIYHVDGNLIEDRRSTNDINTEEHQGFYPIAADGDINLASCPFPGTAEVTKLTDNSDPAMETWDGQPFNRSITSIEMVNETISFDFMYIQDGSPLDLQATTEDEQSIELSWTPAEEDHDVLLAWSPDGEFGTPSDGETYSVGDKIDGGGTVLYYGINDTTYFHSDLEPSTEYYYSVWSNKGDMYSRNLKKHTQTRPEPVSTFPWTDGFENGLSNWYEEFVSGSNAWTEEGPGFNDYPAEAYSGTSFASLYAKNWSGPTTRLVSPIFELQESETYYLSFRHIQAEWEGDQDELKVLIRTQSSDTWEEIAYYNQNITEWGEHRLKLPVSEPLEIAFEGTANYGYGIGLDEIELRTASDCAETPSESASNMTASNITKNSMDIDWTRGNGDGVLVVARQDTSVYELPDQGVDYSANAEFGTGDQIADGTYVVYNGSGENFSLTGLQHTSDYHLAFFEYYEG